MSGQNVFANLGLEANLYKVDEAEAKVPKKPGLYAIYIDSVDALPAPFANDLRERGSCLLYIGESKDLRRRLIQQDLKQSNGASTFARSLGAMLGHRPPGSSLRKEEKNYEFDDAGKKAIIGWANIHLMVCWVDYSQMGKLRLPRELEELEKMRRLKKLKNLKKHLIRWLAPLMNITDNPKRSGALRELRHECLEIAHGRHNERQRSLVFKNW